MKQFRAALIQARNERERLIKYTIVCQKNVRMKRFRRHLRLQIEKRNAYQAMLIKNAVLCQRLYRARLFRRLLAKKIEAKRELFRLKTASAIKIQQQWRMHKFRCQMSHYNQSASKIQQWFR